MTLPNTVESLGRSRWKARRQWRGSADHSERARREFVRVTAEAIRASLPQPQPSQQSNGRTP